MNDVTRETVTLNEIDNEADFSVTDYVGTLGTVLGWFGDALNTVSPLVPRLQQFNQTDGVAIAIGIQGDIGLRSRIRFINRILEIVPADISRELSRNSGDSILIPPSPNPLPQGERALRPRARNKLDLGSSPG
jgi:hypothetical protein